MWQCAVDSDCEIGGESGVAVLGMFGVSEVSDDAKVMRNSNQAKNRIMPLLLMRSRRNFETYKLYCQ